MTGFVAARAARSSLVSYITVWFGGYRDCLSRQRFSQSNVRVMGYLFVRRTACVVIGPFQVPLVRNARRLVVSAQRVALAVAGARCSGSAVRYLAAPEARRSRLAVRYLL